MIKDSPNGERGKASYLSYKYPYYLGTRVLRLKTSSRSGPFCGSGWMVGYGGVVVRRCRMRVHMSFYQSLSLLMTKDVHLSAVFCFKDKLRVSPFYAVYEVACCSSVFSRSVMFGSEFFPSCTFEGLDLRGLKISLNSRTGESLNPFGSSLG